jgi:aspartate aminotransferase
VTIDVRNQFPTGDAARAFCDRALNTMAGGLTGSRILAIAGAIRALQAEGKPVCNLTVGDFSPQQFRIPESLARGISEAVAAGETNYPPAVGLPETREAVTILYRRDLGLDYPIESVFMAGGARPPIFATFALVVEPGDTVVYSIPSWNNHYYCQVNGTVVKTVVSGPETNFLPTAGALAPVLEDARLLCLNSPLNPTGTAMSADQLGGICDLILDINRRREAAGERPLMLMYDQVYWMLCHGDVEHVTPVGLRPAMANYTIFVDAISKSFAATGLRVGWGVVPAPLAPRYKALIGHMGSWAPRPEQVATSALLRDPTAIAAYHAVMKKGIADRLFALHDGFETMKAEGLPVHAIAPQGAIYLSVRFDILGRSFAGTTLQTNEDIRCFLLDEALFGLVPFQAFGLEEDSGWMRLSIGAVGLDDIAEGLARIKTALEKLD